MADFTGERVIPEQVEQDLWNEHVARYAFASRLARRKRVLDAACGTGYGSAELARAASSVVGLDVSCEALGYAQARYRLPNVSFLQASCATMPFRTGSFDLVVAFEVIEHIREWSMFLSEIRRVLTPGGQAIISTPNSCYYSASRGHTGPNPYHYQEFTYEEFREELARVFPHVSFFLQNHVEGFIFQPVKTFSAAEARVEAGGGGPDDSHFLVAVCATIPQTGAPTFLYVPRAANILREREQHIEKLDAEIATKNHWIEEHVADHRKLLEMFHAQQAELEERNRWAEGLNGRLDEAGVLIRQLQEELATQRAGYEEKVAELEADVRAKTDWAIEIERQLAAKCDELARCVEALHETEKSLDERTKWALDLERRIQSLETILSRYRASRWVKLGSTFGVGPEVRDR